MRKFKVGDKFSFEGTKFEVLEMSDECYRCKNFTTGSEECYFVWDDESEMEVI